MKAIPEIGFTEQPSTESASAAHRNGRGKHGSSHDFRTLLGHALTRSSRAVAAGSQAEHSPSKPLHPGAPTHAGDAARSAAATLLAEGGGDTAGELEPGDTAQSASDGDASDGSEESAGASQRPGARRRRKDTGPHPSARTGHDTASAAQVASLQMASAAGAAPERGAKPALTRDAAPSLSSPSVAKQPLAPSSSGKQAAGHGRDSEKSREPARAVEPAAALTRPEPASPSAPAEAKGPVKPAAERASADPASALPPPPGWQDVSGAVLRNAAHLRVETAELGALSLHLRVHDGALHLRVDGEAARTVEARAGELSRALAGEGLRLAPIEASLREGAGGHTGAGGEGAHQGDERREAWNQADDARGAQPDGTRSARPGRASGGSNPATVAPGGVHVEA
jgi:hypothetical protein